MARSGDPARLGLIQAMSEVTTNTQEILATMTDLIHSDRVQLCWDFAETIFDRRVRDDET